MKTMKLIYGGNGKGNVVKHINLRLFKYLSILTHLFFFTLYPRRCSIGDASRITKRNTEIFPDESWKSIYFGVTGSKVKVMRHKKLLA